MRFEQNPTDDHEHGIVLEAAQGEVEPVAAAYREHVFLMAKAGKIDKVLKHQREFSEWESSSDHTIFTNHPLSIAKLLESFHIATNEAVGDIVKSDSEPAFDSDAIARRIRLGNKAFQMAGLIKLEYDNDTLHQMLGEQGTSMFDPAQAPKNPSN